MCKCDHEYQASNRFTEIHFHAPFLEMILDSYILSIAPYHTIPYYTIPGLSVYLREKIAVVPLIVGAVYDTCIPYTPSPMLISSPI